MNTKVFKTIQKYELIQKHTNIIVALSGGADSMALLDFLCVNRDTFKINNICACHINHQIRKDADENEEFVKKHCKSRGIEIYTYSADILSLSKKNKESVELCGRKIRYEFLQKKAQELNAVIAAAHTLSDSAETIIFNMARGTGIKGLCGISAKRGNIIRPFIEITKDEVLLYCKQNNIDYYHDTTNDDKNYTRNKIRHDIVTSLKEINESFEQNILSMSELLADDEEYLSKQAKGVYDEIKIEGGIKISDILNSDIAIKKRVIKLFLEENQIKTEKKHIDNIIYDIYEAHKLNFKMNIQKDFFVVCEKDVLYVQKLQITNDVRQNRKISTEIIDNIQKINKNLLNDILDCDKIIGKMKISSRENGDRLTIKHRGVSKSLKKLFNEAKIPAEERKNLIVIRDEAGVLYVEGFGVDRRACVTEETKKAMMIKIL